MELIKVYRYENEEGIGPYWADTDISYRMGVEHSRGDNYPGWRQDFDEHRKSEYVAGCQSIDSLNMWFQSYKEDLHQDGYRVKTYLIPKENVEYGRSGKQLRFKK